MSTTGPTHGHVARSAATVALLVAWLAWPVLADGALITGAPFLGEQATERHSWTSDRMVLLAALAARCLRRCSRSPWW